MLKIEAPNGWVYRHRESGAVIGKTLYFSEWRQTWQYDLVKKVD